MPTERLSMRRIRQLLALHFGAGASTRALCRHSVRASRTAHAVVEFTISKDGTVKDVQISQASGNASMDNSGLRAIMSSNPMPGLPPDYPGSSVRVIFDFDLSMTR